MKWLNKGKEYYEIRLESIGGLGANLCGKMLGELGIRYLDVNSSNFSSYGSEKTGTPVKGYVRYCRKEKEIRIHSPIMEPDLLVVFHQALLKDGSVLRGCTKDTKVIIALEKGQKLPQMDGKIYGLEAQKIAMETGSRINVVMLGAVLKIMGVETAQAGEEIIKDTLGKKYPSSLENNLTGMLRGYKEVKVIEVNGLVADSEEDLKVESQSTNIAETRKKKYEDKDRFEEKKEYVAEETRLGDTIGGINYLAGNTVINDLSPSRQGYIPLFYKEKCINCGLCFSACPDMVFQFAKGEYKGKKMMINQGLDYYHCKGCLRCVDVCPVNALVRGEEATQERIEHFLPNRELLRKPYFYEKSGADGYITSESFLTEKRMEGGEV